MEQKAVKYSSLDQETTKLEKVNILVISVNQGGYELDLAVDIEENKTRIDAIRLNNLKH